MFKLEAGTFYQVPKGLHKIVKRSSDLCVLTYLLKCKNGSNSCYPSYQTISQGLISRREAMRAVKRLKGIGIISVTKTPFKVNTFTINIELINKLTGDTLSLVTPCHPNKNQLNKTKEQKDINNNSISDSRSKKLKEAWKP